MQICIQYTDSPSKTRICILYTAIIIFVNIKVNDFLENYKISERWCEHVSIISGYSGDGKGQSK